MPTIEITLMATALRSPTPRTRTASLAITSRSATSIDDSFTASNRGASKLPSVLRKPVLPERSCSVALETSRPRATDSESRKTPRSEDGFGLGGPMMSEIIRRCTPADAQALAAIYDPIVAHTVISFEDAPPGPSELRRRIGEAGDRFPWLAFERESEVLGYAYASAHRARAAYRWSVDVSVYVAPAAHRCGIARRLYATLFDVLASQGYCAAFAGVALPNEASCNLHLRWVSALSGRIMRSISSSDDGTTSCGSNAGCARTRSRWNRVRSSAMPRRLLRHRRPQRWTLSTNRYL